MKRDRLSIAAASRPRARHASASRSAARALPATRAARSLTGVLVLYVAWLCVAATACQSNSGEPVTEVLVQIYADALVQQAADKLTVEVLSGPASADQLSSSEPELFDLSDSSFRWPATLALVAKPEHEDHVFQLTLYLEKRGTVIARGRVQSGFVKGQTLLLQTTLSGQCLGKLDCAEDQTCVVSNGRASCESAAVDAGSLPRVNTQAKTQDAGTSTHDAGSVDAGQTPSHDAGADAAARDSGAGIQDGGGGCSTRAEVCDNGLDDDCNGDVDCADSACDSITQCVPVGRAYLIVGANEACPAGYDVGDSIYQDLKDPGCAGCGCEPEPKVCHPLAWVYKDALSCMTDLQQSGGNMLSDPINADCSKPIGDQDTSLPSEGAGGIRAQIKASPDACAPKGSAMLLDPVWGASMKLCVKSLRHAGCGVDAFCAPTRQQLCWSAASTDCPSSSVAQTWWRNYTDDRSCQACTCEASGGSCGDVKIQLENGTCGSNTGGKTLADGEKLCDSASIPPSTTLRMVGQPKTGECQSASGVDGKLVPTQPIELCCQK